MSENPHVAVVDLEENDQVRIHANGGTVDGVVVDTGHRSIAEIEVTVEDFETGDQMRLITDPSPHAARMHYDAHPEAEVVRVDTVRLVEKDLPPA